MSRFLTSLHHSRPSPCEGILLADFLYSSDLAGVVILVPKGFVHDGASAPWGTWNIIRPFGRTLRAAVIHDFLYDTRGRWNKAMRAVLGTDTGEAARALADDIFREAMWVDRNPPWNVSWAQRNGAYRLVRQFGREAWET